MANRVRSRKLAGEEIFGLEGCRNYRQYHWMRSSFETGHCRFCNLDRELHKVLFEDELVYAWHAPEETMRRELASHRLVVPKRHIRFEADLTDEEHMSVLEAKRALRRIFGYVGGITHVREGDMRLNAGTVPHLHYNTFVPDGTTEVRISVFKEPKDREANKIRAAGFALRYEAGEKP